jgi:hypothetical protein
MQLRSDGPGDRIASFDAFKITRWPSASGPVWHLAALTNWAHRLMQAHLRTIPPHERPQWTSSTALRFDRRSDADDFADAIERLGA